MDRKIKHYYPRPGTPPEKDRTRELLVKRKLTPRALRFGIQKGHYRVLDHRPPTPPVEWSKWRKEKLQAAIDAAWLFLAQGREYAEIAPRIGRDGITKQRVAQLVKRGCEYLRSRGYVQKVIKGRKKAAK